MKEFRIIESRPATYYWEYIVKAANETEALNKVLDGEIEATEAWAEENGDEDESDFEVYGEEDSNDESSDDDDDNDDYNSIF